MNFVDKLLRFIFSTAVTMVITGVVATMLLPKGLSLRQLPQFYKLVQERKQNVDAWKFLETLRNENETQKYLKEMYAVPVASESIATQATHQEQAMDPGALEAIEKMHISEELKAQVRLAYAATGVAPKIELPPELAVANDSTVKSAEGKAPDRAPASVTTAAPPGSSVPQAGYETKSFASAISILQRELVDRQQKPQN